MTEKKRVFVDIEFADGVVRTVRPLTIKQLRKFIKASEKLFALQSTDSISDEDIDIMMDAAEIIMQGVDPEVAADRSVLEDTIDVEIFWRLFGVAMGNRLEENPNE